MIKVSLKDGSIAWVGILFFFGFSYIFVALNKKKLKKLRKILGFKNKLPYCSTLSLEQFEEYYPNHPILNSVGDWNKMGIPISITKPEYP